MSDNTKDLEKRVVETITEMEDKNYVFPERFAKKDYITVAVMCILCLVIIIIGGFL